MQKRHVLVWVTPAYPPRLTGIARFSRSNGWHLTIEDRIAHHPTGWRGDGALVTLRNDPEMLRFVRNLVAQNIPVVDLTWNRPDFPLPRVSGDHYALGVLAARHFAERNFRHAAWFSTGWTNTCNLRYEGFAQNWPHESPVRWVADEQLPLGRRDDPLALNGWLAANLSAAPKPLAVLAYDDADAARILSVCLEEHLSVPEEIAILGIGGDELICENQEVPLSSVEHDQERTGYEGAALLARLMEGEQAPKEPILIPPAGITARLSTDCLAVKSPVLRSALAYIKGNIAKPIGLDQLCEHTATPKRSLQRLFAEELGRSCSKEIQRQRLALARELLRIPELSIQQVSDRCGFCNQAYLSNLFKAELGITPLQWRKRNTAV